VPALLSRAARPGAEHRVASVDAALDQLVPPLSVLLAATATTAGAAVALRGRGGSLVGRLGAALSVASLAAFAIHVVGGLRVARVPGSVYAALLHAPRVVVWKVVLWLRVLVRPDRVTWARTRRNAP
jgi:hypothetical protein